LWSTEGGGQEKEFTLASTKLEEKEFWLNGMKDAIIAQKKTRHERISRKMTNDAQQAQVQQLAFQAAQLANNRSNN